MTTAPHLDDEQISAIADGESESSEYAAHVEACDECKVRLIATRRVIGAVARPPATPNAATVDSAIEAALSQFDSQAAAAVVPIDTAVTHKSRKRPQVFTITRLAAAAAAVLIVGGIAAGVSQSHHNSGAKSASVGTKAPAPLTQSGDTGSASGAVAAGPNATAGLGTFENITGVVSALRPHVGDFRATSPPASQTASPTVSPTAGLSSTNQCLSQAVSVAGVAKAAHPIFTAALTYQGSPAEVFVFNKADRRIAVVEWSAGCRTAGFSSF